MVDGVRLSADVYRPPGPGPYPVLLMRTPYDKTRAQSDIGYAHPSWYARQGYIVVDPGHVADATRPRASSSTTAREAQDGYDTIEWAAALPGSTGASACTASRTSATSSCSPRHSSHRRCVTICSRLHLRPHVRRHLQRWRVRARHRRDRRRRSIALESLGARATTRHSRALRRASTRLTTARTGRCRSTTIRPSARRPGRSSPSGSITRPTTSYWRPYSVSDDYSRIAVPALHIGGWYDVCLRGTLQNFLGLRAEAGSDDARRAQKLLIGPWYHMPWTDLDGLERERGAEPASSTTGSCAGSTTS